MRWGIGSRNASAFSISEAEVQSPPVTARAPVVCTVVSCLTMLAVPLSLAAVEHGRGHQTSMAYRILIWKNLNGKTCINEPDGTEWCKKPKKLVYFVHGWFIQNIIAHLYPLHLPVDTIFLWCNIA